ncbi:MAG TPA: di-heme oxidoredictase family protein [Burkholderiales bacterium]|nr:di-heme oxidoredictase family protein [Burkholderiales bacterium]
MTWRAACAATVALATYSATGCPDTVPDAALMSGGSSTVIETGREAYALPSPALPSVLDDTFFLGRNLFRQVWVVAPALDRETAGLGPLFNRPSCAACHLKNGRGRAPVGPGEKMTTMLVRLSLPGRGPHGGPLPDPVYGDQLNDAAVPGIPAEGQARIRWLEHTERLADGEQISLRRPRVEFSELAYGPLGDDILVSPRIAPPVFGLGLLEAVADRDIRARADPTGRHGRVNEVWDPVGKRMALGRFGWKAGAASLLHQSASAFSGDLGITTSVFPDENCSAPQTACRAAPSAGTPEVEDARLGMLVLYQKSLAVPARRDVANGQVRQGERLFAEIGCADCHLPQMRTADDADPPFLSGQVIHPYTDLLLHDMGEGLADGRPEFSAGPSHWRTPPLWGIGLSSRVNGNAAYLHDGRARTLLEALLWHGGEAQAAAQAVRGMSRMQRNALLRFLDSL